MLVAGGASPSGLLLVFEAEASVVDLLSPLASTGAVAAFFVVEPGDFFFFTGSGFVVLVVLETAAAFGFGLGAGGGSAAGWTSDFLNGFSFLRPAPRVLSGPALAGGGAARGRQIKKVVQRSRGRSEFMGGRK